MGEGPYPDRPKATKDTPTRRGLGTVLVLAPEDVHKIRKGVLEVHGDPGGADPGVLSREGLGGTTQKKEQGDEKIAHGSPVGEGGETS
jgi:hypothetical protein